LTNGCLKHPKDPFRGRSGQQVVLVSGGAPLRADPAIEERMAQMKAPCPTQPWVRSKLEDIPNSGQLQ